MLTTPQLDEASLSVIRVLVKGHRTADDGLSALLISNRQPSPAEQILENHLQTRAALSIVRAFLGVADEQVGRPEGLNLFHLTDLKPLLTERRSDHLLLAKDDQVNVQHPAHDVPWMNKG